MTRTRVGWIISIIVGLAAGVGLWFVATAILVLAGFSFYAVHVSAYFALGICIIGSPLVYAATKKRNPHSAKYRVAPLLLGTLLMTLYLAIGMLIAHP